MTARPILFSGEMVRALLDGRKSQTRRVVKPQPPPNNSWTSLRDFGNGVAIVSGPDYPDTEKDRHVCPYGRPGDLLWVRETFGLGWEDGDGAYYAIGPADPDQQHVGRRAFYAADFSDPPDAPRRPWRPSIHMPRWASRLTLEITDVRVQRVQEISEEDAKSEGVESGAYLGADGEWHFWSDGPRAWGFGALWDSLNAARGYGWAANPWVWALTFTVHRCNVDQMPRRAA